jgi:hypothetical protein
VLEKKKKKKKKIVGSSFAYRLLLHQSGFFSFINYQSQLQKEEAKESFDTNQN